MRLNSLRITLHRYQRPHSHIFHSLTHSIPGWFRACQQTRLAQVWGQNEQLSASRRCGIRWESVEHRFLLLFIIPELKRIVERRM